MSRCKQAMDFGAVDEALGKLFAAQIGLGKEALKLLPEVASSALDLWDSVGLPESNCGCDIPDPCWMPKNIGEICCTLACDDVGEICLLISNEDFIAHNYQLRAAGEHGALVQFSVGDFVLGPKERKMVSVKFDMSKAKRIDLADEQSCCSCNDYEVLVWVHGCHNHYLNWYINQGDKSADCCHELDVVDAPDYELHWYDHFHIYRPCIGPSAATKG